MASENFGNMNPLHGIYGEFEKLFMSVIIKYNYKAEKLETNEIKRAADQFLAAYHGRDTYMTYRNYTTEELRAVGITDLNLLQRYLLPDGYLDIPERYRQPLLENRRLTEIQKYEEGNDYYRMLEGKPPIDTPKKKFHYLTPARAAQFDVDPNIPIHNIRQYYNALGENRGDYIISNIEALGDIDNLIKAHPDEEYLHYIGHQHISVPEARESKNFQILHIEQGTVADSIYNTFLTEYEHCRDYFVTVIFVRELRSCIYYYDNFIALCIMLMAIQSTINKEFPLGIQREYFTVYLLKMLYEAYGVPYDLTIDQYTQSQIARVLNLLIQRKATDRVIYDIAGLLGFPNLEVYKYYLVKNHKSDIYGVPIIAYTKEWNDDTYTWDTIPDYEAMYDIYWQKAELKDKDVYAAFSKKTLQEEYLTPVTDDPYWWEDSDLYKAVWETEYNFVESKYFGIALSYKMSDILYESVMLLKMLQAQKDPLDSIVIELPKIAPNLKVTIFDAIIMLLCLLAKKHHLRGEIIAIPTQVLDVLDYMHNTDGGDDYLVDAFAFNFDYFKDESSGSRELVNHITKILGEEEARKFNKYLEILTISDELPNKEKVEAINKIFTNVKGLSDYIMYLMCKTDKRDVYESLKQFYRCAFYSREVKNIFTINEGDEELERTAFTYFEFLYYYNPALYASIFTPNYEEQYQAYIKKNGYSPEDYPMVDEDGSGYIRDVEEGWITDFTYSNLNYESTITNVKDELLYYYIEHIIAKIEGYINNLSYAHMINDAASTLEVLLMRFIRYFKSFTIDLVGLDIIYIMDMRSENTMRLFDEVARIIKWIETHDHILLAYADVMHLLTTTMQYNDKHMLLYDKETHNKILEVAKLHGIPINKVDLQDVLFKIVKTIYAGDSRYSKDNLLYLIDMARSEVSNLYQDRMRRDQTRFLTDKAIIQYEE